MVANLFTFKYWFQTCIKRFFGKVDLFAPLLSDIEAIILCSFDFDLKKKNPPAHTYSKNVVEDNQAINFSRLNLKKLGANKS